MIKFDNGGGSAFKVIGRFETLTKDLKDTSLEGIAPEKKVEKQKLKFGVKTSFGLQEALKASEKPAFGLDITKPDENK